MILLSGLIFYTQLIFAEHPYQGWQGEWGKWEKDSKGKYKGASISIFDCDNNTCKVRLEHNDDYDYNGELTIISATEANVHSKIFSDNLHLQRVVTTNHPQIIMKAEGEWCKTYPSTYDFRTEHSYLDGDGVLPPYKLVCYADNDPGIRTWCESPEVLNYDSQAAILIQSFEQDPSSVGFKMDDWRTDSLKACRYQKDFLSCYKNRFTKLEVDIKNAINSVALSATSEKNAPLESTPDTQANLKIYDLPTTHPNPYTVGEEMQKGEPIPIPREFRDGTATLQNVKDWSNAYWVSWNYDIEKQPPLEPIDLEKSEDGMLAMLMEAQNPTYFLFKKTARGYQYIDTVAGSSHYQLYYRDTKHLYLYFTWHMSSDEEGVTLSQIQNGILKELAGIWIKDNKVYNNSDKEKENLLATNLLNKLFDGTLTESELKIIFHL